MMWRSISQSIISFGSKRSSEHMHKACHEDSSDGESSNASCDEELECPICWESFNIVENVPYVLWCGHTLCKTCVMGLRCATIKCSAHRVHIPFFISCPWCNLLTFRLVYRGNLKFPSKNFFLLWMVESKNGDRVRSSSAVCRDSVSYASSSNNQDRDNDSLATERTPMSFHKSLDFLIRVTSKFPLVVLFLIIILFALPTSIVILMLYLIITILFALPAFLVLYFAYPALNWLAREMRA